MLDDVHRDRTAPPPPLVAPPVPPAAGDGGPPDPAGDAAHREGEPHAQAASGTRLNWLRAGVLGANDGIVSVAGIVVGVAGATSARGPIFTAGLAGLVAGAVSMALGEYVSVSSQRDTEQALMAKERRELHEYPEHELAELAEIYRAKGLAAGDRAAGRRRAHRARRARPRTLDAELRIDPDDLANPRAGRRGVRGVVHRRRAAAAAGDPAAARRPGGCRSPWSRCWPRWR